MHSRGLIGVDAAGVGFGNISVRYYQNQFIVSGSSTGMYASLGVEHYALVTSFSIDNNTVDAEGLVMASSESMTHAVLYQCSPDVNAVVHIHSTELWRKLLHNVPTTRAEVEYGTPGMAREVIRLYGNSNLPIVKLFAMEGHPDGVVAFGRSLSEACGIILSHL